MEINNGTATLNKEEVPDGARLSSDLIVIKTIPDYAISPFEEWHILKPGIAYKIVGFVNDSFECDELICDDILKNFPDVKGDLHSCRLYQGKTLLYVSGYLRCKIEAVEYETFKLDIIE